MRDRLSQPLAHRAAFRARENCSGSPIRTITIKRERGRRGLEILNQLQRVREIDLTIHDSADDSALPVDTRIVRVAQVLQARLLTNDLPLCQVARLQQVPC